MTDATMEAQKDAAQVKRYRWHHDGMWCLEPNEVPPTAQWVSADSYDTLARQHAALQARVDESDNRIRSLEAELEAARKSV